MGSLLLRPGAPGERHLYTVTDFESGRPGVVNCISCGVTNSRLGIGFAWKSFAFVDGVSVYRTINANDIIKYMND